MRIKDQHPKRMYAFKQTVSGAGYEWTEQCLATEAPFFDDLPRILARDGLCLIPKKAPGDQPNVQVYDPMQLPELHRRFADLDPTMDVVCRFATKYGMLGRSFMLNGSRSGPFGEAYMLWRYEIAVMKELLKLWDLVNTGSAEQLSMYIIWHPSPRRVEFRTLNETEMDNPWIAQYPFAAPQKTVGLLDKWGFGNVIEPARWYVCEAISQRLRGRTNIEIVPGRTNAIVIRPDSLYAVMYMLFMHEVKGNPRSIVQCKGCDDYFQPAHGRQVFHDENCRQRFHHGQRRKRTKVDA